MLTLLRSTHRKSSVRALVYNPVTPQSWTGICSWQHFGLWLLRGGASSNRSPFDPTPSEADGRSRVMERIAGLARSEGLIEEW